MSTPSEAPRVRLDPNEDGVTSPEPGLLVSDRARRIRCDDVRLLARPCRAVGFALTAVATISRWRSDDLKKGGGTDESQDDLEVKFCAGAPQSMR